MKKTVIGVTGPFGAGKEVPYRILKEMGCKIVYLGDRTREEANRRGLPHDRNILQDMGNDLREKLGHDILVRQTEEKELDGTEDRLLFDGIRHLGEIDYLREKYGAFILGVNTTIERRREFTRKRKGDADPQSDTDFHRNEQRDRGIGEGPHGQQVEACLREADIVIQNDGTKEELVSKFLEALAKFGIEGNQGQIEKE